MKAIKYKLMVAGTDQSMLLFFGGLRQTGIHEFKKRVSSAEWDMILPWEMFRG